LNKSLTVRSAQLAELQAATTFANGAILIDEYDNIIFDDVLRKYPLWNRIDKRPAPGETTGGFDQTGVPTGRSAPVRNLGYTATSPTRAARTRRDIKAIVSNLEFTIFDRSVYQQQGRRFGNLEAKDVNDLNTAVMRHWQGLAYDGDDGVDPNEFDGLKALIGAGTTVTQSTSIIKAINEEIVSMTNTSTKDVMPTAIYTNAQVVWHISLELLKMGDRILYAPIQIGSTVFQVAQLATPIGFLPLFADPYNGVVSGTPNSYPTFIVSEDKLSWQYVEVLGMAGADPKTFEIALANDLDQQYSTLMFGAMELLGGTDHHSRLNIQDRTTVVDPTA
jgi:hypothetical protein